MLVLKYCFLGWLTHAFGGVVLAALGVYVHMAGNPYGLTFMMMLCPAAAFWCGLGGIVAGLLWSRQKDTAATMVSVICGVVAFASMKAFLP